VPAPPGRVVGGVLGRLQLGDDPGKPLGHGVVDLPGHPLPLVQDSGLPGLGQQLLVQARILGQRGLELGFGLAHLGQCLLTPVLLLVVVPVEPGQRAHRQHIDGHHGEIGR
jgi:hypothetical protein